MLSKAQHDQLVSCYNSSKWLKKSRVTSSSFRQWSPCSIITTQIHVHPIMFLLQRPPVTSQILVKSLVIFCCCLHCTDSFLHPTMVGCLAYWKHSLASRETRILIRSQCYQFPLSPYIFLSYLRFVLRSPITEPMDRKGELWNVSFWKWYGHGTHQLTIAVVTWMRTAKIKPINIPA